MMKIGIVECATYSIFHIEKNFKEGIKERTKGQVTFKVISVS